MNSTPQPELLLRRIEELIARRSSTDRRMGYIWMLIPILPVLLGLALAVSFIGTLFSALSSLGSLSQAQAASTLGRSILELYALAIASFYLVVLLGAFAFYYLVDRRNNHLRRQQQLFDTIQRYLGAKANSYANGGILQLEQLSEDSTFEEHQRPAGLWSTLYLFVTPIVGLILAYNLDHDLRRHEELQSAYVTVLASVLSATGTQPTLPPQRSHKRDPILFIVLTAITAGLFWIYWFYTLLKDYNEHFLDQSRLEDQILAVLRPEPSHGQCSVCGAAVPEGARFCPYCGKMQ